MQRRNKKVFCAMAVMGVMSISACGQTTEENVQDVQNEKIAESEEVTVPEIPETDFKVTITMENASPFHDGKFEGWGTSFCWWANRIGYSDVLSEKAAKAFYDKEEGLGLNIVRYNIGGGDDPTHAHITRTDSEVPGYAINPTYDETSGTYTWEYDWTQDANQRNVLQKVMENYGEDIIVEGFSNSPPYFMTNSGCSSGAENASDDNLREDAYDAFATYLVDVAEHFDSEWGVRFQSMTGMNEPYTSYWHAYSDKQEGCHFEYGESQSKMIVALRNALNERGMGDVQVSGTDETSIDTQLITYNNLSPQAKESITRIDTHSYSGTSLARMKEVASSEGKNLWMSEVDGGDIVGRNAGQMGAGLWLARQIINDMNGMEPSAWILWQVIDNHISKDGYHGKTDSGMVDVEKGYWGTAVADHDNEDILLTMKYYTFGQFTRYIRPGDTIISGDKRSLAAYDAENQKLTIVVMNSDEEEISYYFDLSSFSEIGTSAQVIRTSGSLENGEKWKELAPIETLENGLEVNLKGNSVTTFVIENIVE